MHVFISFLSCHETLSAAAARVKRFNVRPKTASQITLRHVVSAIMSQIEQVRFKTQKNCH